MSGDFTGWWVYVVGDDGIKLVELTPEGTTLLDATFPEKWVGDALFRPETREAYRELVGQGWTDAIRTLHPDERIYTFWDYLRDAYGRNAGLRLDHFLLNKAVAKRLKSATVDKHVRGWQGASDHAPVWILLE